MPMTAERGVDAHLDTSTAIALLVADHEDHHATLEATHGMRLSLAGHAWFETFSVLTRMPPGVRRGPAVVHRLLAHNFSGSWFLDEQTSAGVADEVVRARMLGGAVYDALVGAAARRYDLPLITGDRRAIRTYNLLGVSARLIE
jgi:predicted nucleic acid-binding protein